MTWCQFCTLFTFRERSAGGLHCSQKAKCGSDADQKQDHNVNMQHVLRITYAYFKHRFAAWVQCHADTAMWFPGNLEYRQKSFEYIYTCHIATQTRMHLNLLFKFSLQSDEIMVHLHCFIKDKDSIRFEHSRKKALPARPSLKTWKWLLKPVFAFEVAMCIPNCR